MWAREVTMHGQPAREGADVTAAGCRQLPRYDGRKRTKKEGKCVAIAPAKQNTHLDGNGGGGFAGLDWSFAGIFAGKRSVSGGRCSILSVTGANGSRGLNATVGASQERKEQPKGTSLQSGQERPDRESSRPLIFPSFNCNQSLLPPLLLCTQASFLPQSDRPIVCQLCSARLLVEETAGKGQAPPQLTKTHRSKSSTAPPCARPHHGPLFSLPSAAPPVLANIARASSFATFGWLRDGLRSAAFSSFRDSDLVCLSHQQPCLGICPSSVSLPPSFNVYPFRRPPFEFSLCSTMLAS